MRGRTRGYSRGALCTRSRTSSSRLRLPPAAPRAPAVPSTSRTAEPARGSGCSTTSAEISVKITKIIFLEISCEKLTNLFHADPANLAEDEGPERGVFRDSQLSEYGTSRKILTRISTLFFALFLSTHNTYDVGEVAIGAQFEEITATGLLHGTLLAALQHVRQPEQLAHLRRFSSFLKKEGVYFKKKKKKKKKRTFPLRA